LDANDIQSTIQEIFNIKSLIESINSDYATEKDENIRNLEAIEYEFFEQRKNIKCTSSTIIFGRKILPKHSNWTTHIEHFNHHTSTTHLSQRPLDNIRLILKSIQALNKIQGRLIRLQSIYKRENMEFLLKSNKAHEFAQKMLFKERSNPVTNGIIYDKSSISFRKQCLNEDKELTAINQYHGKWMANASCEEICTFAKLKIDEDLGMRGIQLDPQRIVTMENVPKLIPNGNKLPKKIKEVVIRAHETHTTSLFAPPKMDIRALYYPFYL